MSNIFSRLDCPNCGQPIREADSVCPHCGLDLDRPLTESELQALAEPYIQKARQSLESGRHVSAGLEACEQALEYLPDSAEAHNLRGLLLDALGRTAAAIEEYKEALSLDPDYQDAKENLAEAKAEAAASKSF